MNAPAGWYILLLYIQRFAPGRNFLHLDNLGIMTIAAFLDSKEYRARSFTGISTEALKIAEEEILRQDLKAIGLYCDYDNLSVVVSFSRSIKAKYGIPIIVGGPQAFHLGPTFLRESQCDFLIKGDGEQALWELLESLREGRASLTSIAGLSYIDSTGTVAENPASIPDRNLDDRPFPRTALLLKPRKRYALSVITGRGCPYRCSFCFEGGNTKVFRPRSVKDVMAEIRLGLRENPDTKYLIFQDDTFTWNRVRIIKFAQELSALRKKRDFVWFCEAHSGLLADHPGLVEQMIAAGLQRMQIGFESGCQSVLDLYRKKTSPQKLRDTVRQCWEAGLPQLAGNFIIGGPLENAETLRITGDFIQELLESYPGMLDLSTTFVNPLPNTPISSSPEEFGMKITDPGMLTSLEDFPVNETVEMDRVAICRARRKIVETISETMKRQFRENRIPSWRMQRHYELAMKFMVSSSWYNYILSRDEVCRNYHYLRLFTSARALEEIDVETLEQTFPLRVAPLEKLEKDLKFRENRLLTEPDRRILQHCEGKIRLDTFFPLVRNGNFLTGMSAESFLDKIRCFAGKRWLVFSTF
jgi:anaerobic magnesium-protoporphyrin IX monomethyl ester cyclase